MAEHGALPDAAQLGPSCGREPLIAAITTFLAVQDPDTLDEMRECLEREIDEAGPEALAALVERLATAGTGWDYYPRDPLARRIHHVLADRILEQDPVLFGVEHLDAVADRPVVLFANHLSYSDANLLEVALARAGGAAMSNRLTVIAGPKVYSNLKRRFSSLCFGTIKTPQSSARSTEDAVMNTRQVARAARLCIDIALARLQAGDALLVFAEGARSRTSGMQPMLPGVTRYLECPGTWVLPVGITGTEAMFPIGDDTLHAVPTVTRVGRPIDARVLRERADGDRRLMMDAIGLAIADLLPPEYRGTYGESFGDLAEARRLLSDLSN